MMIQHMFRRIPVWAFTFVISLGLLAPTTDAATYFVGTFGSDNRNNNQAQNGNTPWRTIQNAVNRAGVGDTIVVIPGTYYERVYIQRSGERGRPLTLRSQVTHGAKVVGSISGDDRQFVTIDGFDVENPGGAGQTKGISFVRSHHVVIQNNKVHNCFGGGIGLDQSDWLLIQWNQVYENAFYDPGAHSGISIYQAEDRSSDTAYYGIEIRQNTCYFNQNLVDNPNFGRPTDGNGIVIDDLKNDQRGGTPYSRRTLIENNFCFENGGQGIHCYQSLNIDIANNTTYGNKYSFDFGGELSLVRSDNVAVFNNIFHAINGSRAGLNYKSTGLWLDYNVIIGPTQDISNGPSTIYQMPTYIAGTLTPAANSSNVDHGISFGPQFPYDVDGQPRVRGAGIDIGAKER